MGLPVPESAGDGGGRRPPNAFRTGHKLPKVLSLEDFRKLMAALPNHECRVLTLLLFSTGCRSVEFLGQHAREHRRDKVYYQDSRHGLRYRDVDLRNGTIKVRGKGDKERIVAVVASAMSELKAWIESQRTAGAPPDAPVFPKYDRCARNYRLALDRASARAGIPHVSPHQARHSFAAWCLRGGCDIRWLQEQMGHASTDTTARYLAVVTDDLVREVNKAHPLANQATYASPRSTP